MSFYLNELFCRLLVRNGINSDCGWWICVYEYKFIIIGMCRERSIVNTIPAGCGKNIFRAIKES